MNQLIQAAITAANAGDKRQALIHMKQALTENPRDVEAWLVVAGLMDNPEKKRQALDKVLEIDPRNISALNEIRNMAGAPASTADTTGVPGTAPQQRPAPVSTEAPRAAPAPVQNGPSIDSPQTFERSLFYRIWAYGAAIFISLSICGSLFSNGGGNGFLVTVCVGMMWLILIPFLLEASTRIIVDNRGVSVSRLWFMNARIDWNEIASIKAGRTPVLIGQAGKKVTLNNGVTNYDYLVETIRQKRPDLFGILPASQAGAGSQPTPFTGEKTFKRTISNMAIGYGVGIFILLLGLGAVCAGQSNSSMYYVAIPTILLAIVALGYNFVAPQEVVLRPNQLTIITNIGQQTINKDAITSIELKTVRTRYGANNFVVIKANKKDFSLAGFESGPTIQYGILMNWWEN